MPSPCIGFGKLLLLFLCHVGHVSSNVLIKFLWGILVTALDVRATCPNEIFVCQVKELSTNFLRLFFSHFQIFDVNGRVLTAFGGEGSDEGQFKFPRYVKFQAFNVVICNDLCQIGTMGQAVLPGINVKKISAID